MILMKILKKAARLLLKEEKKNRINSKTETVKRTAFIVSVMLLTFTAVQAIGTDAYAKSNGTSSTGTIIAPRKTETISETKADGTVISEATEKPMETISDEVQAADVSTRIITSKATDGKSSAVVTTETAAQSTSENSDTAKAESETTQAVTETKSTAAAVDTEKIKAALAGPESTAIAGTGSALSTGGFKLQGECYDNLDDEPLLSGGEVRFLANTGSAAQQLSAVFKSSDGKVIVVDGGQEADTEHLVSVIKEFGGNVDAWLITHPQTDHAGALNKILKEKRSDISIDGIYYNFLEQAWYDENDPDECGMVRTLRENMAQYEKSKLHSDMSMGNTVKLSDNLSFKVLNSPQKSTGIFAGNSAGLMYDIILNGKHFIILGDMARDVGDKLMAAGVLDDVSCDFVQISHHGQTGVSDEFYNKLNPSYCIWPTNEHIYNAASVNNSGLETTKTKICISKLKVKRNFVTLGRDVIIK